MGKKIVFNGIEILTHDEETSKLGMLEFVEAVIDRLESDLERADENFHIYINMEFSPGRPPRQKMTTSNLLNESTTKKVSEILKTSVFKVRENTSGTLRVSLQIEDDR